MSLNHKFIWWCHWKDIFSFGDVIWRQQNWWLSINLQSNKVTVIGQFFHLNFHWDRVFQMMSIVDCLPFISDLVNSPLSEYITTLMANDCGYGGTSKENMPILCSWEHTQLQAPNWKEATRGQFTNDYWKAMELKIIILESITAWNVKECKDDMKVIYST